MKITIDIPKEFEKEYIKDRFNETFERVLCDLNHKDAASMAGNYEIETLEMLQKALKDSETADIK